MMKLVYSVCNEVRDNPAKVAAAQKLTLNKKRSQGLKGTYGLYGSQEWLDNLQSGRIPQRKVSGIIRQAYKDGMYESDNANTIEIETELGSVEHMSIYANNDNDILLFQKGKKVEVSYFIEDLKRIEVTTGENKTYDFVYEMKVEV
jgi:hypothetical protein